MKSKLVFLLFVLSLAACGEITATPLPAAAPDLTAAQIAVEEQESAARTVESTVATNPPASAPSATATPLPTDTATPLPTDTPTTAATPTSPPAMLLAAEPGTTIQLPPPNLKGAMSLEEALATRRSVREFEDLPLTVAELGQLLWAAQGITDQQGRRTAPSARALYPLELFIATGEGVFQYDPQAQRLIVLGTEDCRARLYQASGGQESVRQAPAVLVVTAVYDRTTDQFGQERGPRYVHLEAGHATQNLLLQATALGLGAVPVGAFDDQDVQEALGLPAGHEPLYLVPVGHPRVGSP